MKKPKTPPSQEQIRAQVAKNITALKAMEKAHSKFIEAVKRACCDQNTSHEYVETCLKNYEKKVWAFSKLDVKTEEIAKEFPMEMFEAIGKTALKNVAEDIKEEKTGEAAKEVK